MVIVHHTGIYAYSREHALAARRKARGELTESQLLGIKKADSKNFIDLQIQNICDYVSDGQFLWKDLSRPFHGSEAEENLEMVRRADTNTFMRCSNIKKIDDVTTVDLSKFILHHIENQQIAVLGPYSYSQIAKSSEKISKEEIQIAYAKALANSLAKISSDGISHILISEPFLGETKLSTDIWQQEKENLKTIISNLKKINTTLGFFYYRADSVWPKLLELPTDNIAVDLRSRDYFNPIPSAESLTNSHKFLFELDTTKKIILGCINGRNGGFTPSTGLETAEWIADVIRLAHEKNNDLEFGVTFSTDETILPRGLADAKLKNMGVAKKILAQEGL